MKRIYLLFLFCGLANYSIAQQIPKAKASQWVSNVEVKPHNDKKTDGAYNYLLIDFQDNIPEEEQFVHYAIQVLNSEGIQEFSDISVSFDPAFQNLTFHQILITRNNKKINKLIDSEINVFQRESNLERSLYDGSLTAVVNLSDIRKGDIIEYAYTIKGFNPINKGNYSGTLYLQYTAPVNTIHHRIISNEDRPINYKLLDGANEPQITRNGKTVSYTWEVDGTDYFQYDVNVPYWLNIQKRISISTFKDWKAVVDLSLPLYTKNLQALSTPKELELKGLNKEAKILKLIRFVQDEVRYLGFESGIGAYQPNPPTKVLQQRYGDCKDKSLLLVNLLRTENVEAFPILVNTEIKDEIYNLLPSHNLFNHCIVQFNHEGESYFIDPTITGQGGDLENITFPKYSAGLIVKKNNTSLTSIRDNRIIPKLSIEETITSDSIGGSAIFLIKTTYSGSKADEMRDYFKSNSEESITNEFVNYYSSLYPSIQSFEPVRFNDNFRDGKNEVVIEEYYNINKFWGSNEDNGLFEAQTEPLVLESMLEYPNTPERTTSYYLGEPYEFKQKTTIALPESWNIRANNYKIDKDAFSYNKTIRNIGKTIEIIHDYKLKKNKIQPEYVAPFLKNHEKINNQISYQISHPGDNVKSTSSSINWLSIVIAMLTVGLGIFFSKKIYEEYNPIAQANSSYKENSLGGWLIIPLIGLILTPFMLIFQIAQNGYFDSGIWSVFHENGYENATALTISVGLELIYNLALLIFTILLLILFFKKRTSLPKLIIIFYALNVFVPIAELLLVLPLFPKEMATLGSDRETYSQIGRSIIGAAIWIPYFMISERVKDTFQNTYES